MRNVLLPRPDATVTDNQGASHRLIDTLPLRIAVGRSGRGFELGCVNRRDFLKGASLTITAVAAADLLSLSVLRPASASVNPLAGYPQRDWETLYRDIYAHDDSFVFVCTPNCTHNCYLEAYVKNGVITRCGPTQRYNEATDLYGT